VTDASVKNFNMGRFWIITDREKSIEITNKIYCKQWIFNTEKEAELIVLLELLEVLARKGKYIMSRSIEVWIDNKYVNQKVYGMLLKPSLYSQDASTKIMRIRKILDIINFNIKLNIVSGYLKVRAPYKEDPSPYLILRYY